MTTYNLSNNITTSNQSDTQNVEQADTVVVSLTCRYGVSLQSSSNCSVSIVGGGSFTSVVTLTITFSNTGSYSAVFYQGYGGKTYTLSGTVSQTVTITPPVISSVTHNNALSSSVGVTVNLSSNGSGGTLKFAQTTGTSVPSSGWTSSGFFSNHPRNSTRYYWASQDENTSGAFDGPEGLTVGYRAPGTSVYVNNETITPTQTSVSIQVGSTTVGDEYAIRLNNGSTNLATTTATSSTTHITLSSNLPTEGNTTTYEIFARAPVSNGGTNTWTQSNKTFTIYRELSADTTPDAFSFADESNAPINSVRDVSVQITGITAATTVSRTSGDATFQVSSSSSTPSSFSSTNKTITNNQYLHVRMTSSSSFSTAKNTVMDVGGVTDTWTVTTVAQDTQPDSVIIPDVYDVNTSSAHTSFDQITGFTGTLTATRTSGDGTFVVTGSTSTPLTSSFTSADKSITSGQYLHVRQVASSSNIKCKSTLFEIGGAGDRHTVTTKFGTTADHDVTLGVYYYGLEFNGSTTQTLDVAAGETINVVMDGNIGTTFNSPLLDNVHGVFTLTNCTANTTTNVLCRDQISNQSNAVNGITLTPTASAGQSYSMVATFTHLNSGGSSVVKTFTLQGTVDPPAYGMEIFDASGDRRLRIDKRTPRVVGRVAGTASGSSNFNLYFQGYGVGGLSQWHAVNTYPDSSYAPDPSSSTTNNLLMVRADVRFANSSYQFFTGDQDYDVLILRF